MAGTDSIKTPDQVIGHKLLAWNTVYVFSAQGFLNILQIIICYTCVVLMSDACRPAYSSTVGGFVGTKHDTYFYIVAYACFIMTNIVLGCFIFSHTSYTLMSRTIVLFTFWLVCAIISMAASSLLLISITYPIPKELQIMGYTHKAASSILGIVNALLYSASCLQAYRTCKNNWMSLPFSSCD